MAPASCFSNSAILSIDTASAAELPILVVLVSGGGAVEEGKGTWGLAATSSSNSPIPNSSGAVRFCSSSSYIRGLGCWWWWWEEEVEEEEEEEEEEDSGAVVVFSNWLIFAFTATCAAGIFSGFAGDRGVVESGEHKLRGAAFVVGLGSSDAGSMTRGIFFERKRRRVGIFFSCFFGKGG